MTATISSTIGGSAGYRIPLLRGGRPAGWPGWVADERRRPAASNSTVMHLFRSDSRDQRRPRGNKGMRYPADPPTVEEIVAVMRHAPMTVTAGACER